MRTRYYRPEDQVNEQNIGDRCSAAWSLPWALVAADENPYDAEFYDEQMNLQVVAEFKVRNMKWGQYPDIMLSKSKIDRVLAAIPMGVGAVFVIRVTNGGIFWTDLRGTAKLPVKLGGRTKNTRDVWDVEDVVHIPIKNFHTLGDVKPA